jgi:hypothetical protein
VTDAAHPPRLCLNDGSAVPRLGANDAYKHIRVWRTMNGDTTAAAKAFHDKAREVNARIKQLRLPVRALFRAADIAWGNAHVPWHNLSGKQGRVRCSRGWVARHPPQKIGARALVA